MDDILCLWKKRTNELSAARSGGTVVLAMELEVLCGKHLSLNLHYFRRKRVVVVAVVEFARVLQVDFENVCRSEIDLLNRRIENYAIEFRNHRAN